jgi:tRNA nucleotidyltransferase (CCA-adding enzyme)
LLQRCDAIRRPERFEQVLLACECDARGRTGLEHRDYPQAQRLRSALQAALSIDAGALASQAQGLGLQGAGVARHIDAAREAQIANTLA